MEKTSSAPSATLSTRGGNKSGKRPANRSDKKDVSQLGQSVNSRGLFFTMALTMSWQLAVVVLVPILAGVKLDKSAGTGYTYTFVGLGVAVVGSAVVMWHAMQVANRIPVPKLTAAQKRAIKKAYEEEDKDE